ncbi:hypothetical protein ACHAW6_004311 [Cyclotella cf. meneghiniana]
MMPLALSLTTPTSNIVILGLDPTLQKLLSFALRCLAGSEESPNANVILLAQFIGWGPEGDAVLKKLEKCFSLRV